MSQTDSKQGFLLGQRAERRGGGRGAGRCGGCRGREKNGIAAGRGDIRRAQMATVQREGGDGRDEQHEQPHRKGEIQAAGALFGFGAAAVDRREHGALILCVEADGAEALVDGFANGRVFFHRTQPLSSS